MPLHCILQVKEVLDISSDLFSCLVIHLLIRSTWNKSNFLFEFNPQQINASSILNG